ncbi:hypothetical protein EOD41_04080 [Mucilaginibacter limnophilus]|uniref:DUF1571 domain-containing protein n=1 Tax=Mucilaginibacter limnophilus TaxID=1932778 RepID=A0A437MZM5_9SPHI|nr:hypothetical protein [Mucilaginibacter limnophilus]RVU03121.1 hypothetical protein EOD41_04080 [Mucilaginibacter limnophilus]
MMKRLPLFFFTLILSASAFAQLANQSTSQLQLYADTLSDLGKQMVNNENDLERKNANYQFIKTLVKALKINNSFLYPFDSLKTISILTSPDKRFRIFSWHVRNNDGSYRFYGTVQMNTGGPLVMHPLEDYSPLIKNPEDSIADNHKWFGAQYYKIIPVQAANPYYILLGWKGNTVESTKKVIEVLSFKNNKPVFGAPVFEGNGKNCKRVVFEYTRQVSMLLRYVPGENLIVFDHLAPPDKKMAGKFDTYGPDLSYDGYRLKNGKWQFVENLDMRNVAVPADESFIDPKKEAAEAAKQIPVKNQ